MVFAMTAGGALENKQRRGKVLLKIKFFLFEIKV
jgi:hypothetical protein